MVESVKVDLIAEGIIDTYLFTLGVSNKAKMVGIHQCFKDLAIVAPACSQYIFRDFGRGSIIL